MRPSQPSNQRYREWQESNPTQTKDDTDKSNLAHSLTIHLPDGDKVTFYYPYLIKAELRVQGLLNAIILRFTSEKVRLQGYKLTALHAEFAGRRPSDIYVYNPRYIVPETVNQPTVIAASVEERKP